MNFIRKCGLINLFDANDEDTQMKILSKMCEEPSKFDKSGYVYGFYDPADTNTRDDFLIKLGRTEQSSPYIRIKQWGGKEVFSVDTIFDRKLERLIHLFFTFAYEEQIVNGKREIEWFHFTPDQKIGNKTITKNVIVRYVSCIDDLLNELHPVADEKCTTTDAVSYTTIPLLTRPNPPHPQSSEAVTDVIQLDLRTCTKNDLEKLIKVHNLSGIGPVKIEAIMTHRRLYNVPKVGHVTIDKLHRYILC
jgi:hypothetical protein